MADAGETLQLLEDCEHREERLSEFERGFIDSAKRQLEEGRSLTKKQADLLDEIWERATARG